MASSRGRGSFGNINNRINNMYNTHEHRKTRALIYNSIRKGTIIQKDKINAYRKMSNERITKCNKACVRDRRSGETEHGGIGSCVVSNTTIGLKDCSSPDSKTRYHYIRPTELAVDTLQWAFNNGKAKIINDKSDKSGTSGYLVFNDLPSLQIETVETDKDGEYRDTRRKEGFYKAYEDDTTLAVLDYSTQLTKYLATGIYHNAVKYTTTDKDIGYVDGITTQNINYVKVIADALKKAYTFSSVPPAPAPAPAPRFNVELTNPQALSGDITGMEKYIIVEPVKLQDGSEYVICGYPDPSKMRTYLSLRDDPNIGKALADIYTMQRTGYAQVFAEMHNSILKAVDGDDGDANQIDLTQLDTEIHKFMKSINITYFESWVKANGQLDASNPISWVNSADFKGKIQLLRDNGLGVQADYIESEIARTCLTPEERTQQLANISLVYAAFAKYVNELLLEYLNKPMTRIRYHFLIYRHDAISGILVPAIFNIKQLDPRHKPLLERVQDLIQMRIPTIFGILEGSRHGLDRYKLFHSYVKYGDFFYITTEYLHTMSNFTHYAYLYENSIELEELIYSLSRVSIVPNFWQSLRIDYQLKKFRVIPSTISLNEPLTDGSRGHSRGYFRGHSRGVSGNWRSGSKSGSRSSNTTKTFRNTAPVSVPLQGTIMMIYEKNYQEYTIIYKDSSDGIFKVLEVKSNLAACTRDIINEVARLRGGTAEFNTIKYGGRLFKVVSNKVFDSKMMKELKNHNPLVVKVMKKPNTDSRYISLKDMIQTDLLNSDILEDIQVINICHFHPIIYFNFMMNMNYILALLKYHRKNINGIINNDKQETNNSTIQYGEYNPVECIINPENCGYDIIVSSRTSAKTVLWIIPHSVEIGIINSNDKYLHNFTFLNKSHISLLNVIKNLFLKEGFLCFVHIQASHIYGLFHLHITKFNEYQRIYPVDKEGNISIITREINIDDIIHKLTIDDRYYIDFTVSKLNVII